MPEAEIAMVDRIMKSDGRMEDMALGERQQDMTVRKQLNKLFSKQ